MAAALLARIRNNPYIPADHRDPTPKQLAALTLGHIGEVFYGGAAGGGKTDWLLYESALYVEIPGYSAILFRDAFTNLYHEPDGLIARSRKWFAHTDAQWHARERTWSFPSGAAITFGALKNPDSHKNYDGPAYHLIGYDEVTAIREQHYLYMRARLRRPAHGAASRIPLRYRGAGNPGGRSHTFFRDRFNLAPEPGTPAGPPAGTGRAYMPAKVWDNPFLDVDAYIETLKHLAPVDRERLLNGDWTVTEQGPIFEPAWFEIIDHRPRGEHWRRARMWDLAVAAPTPRSPDPDYTAGALVAYNELTGEVVIEDIIRFRGTLAKRDQLITRTAVADGHDVIVLLEQEFGAAGKSMVKQWKTILAGYTVRGVEPWASKRHRASPVASVAEVGLVSLVRGPWNRDFLEEAQVFDGEGNGGFHDDQIDAVAGAYHFLTHRRRFTAL